MIDLHSHLLPGVDDGAKDLPMSLEMARLAVDQGITIMACTPHFYPGVYNSRGSDILDRIADLQLRLREADIPLTLVAGGDLRLEPGLMRRLKDGDALTINGSRYALIEPAHQLFTPGMEGFFADLLTAGFQPVLTHPERMDWIDQRYAAIERLLLSGVWMQITAGAVTGQFGRKASYWAERFICEGMAHILATDTHDPIRRPPRMREAYETVVEWVGQKEADNLVLHRPWLILNDGLPQAIPIDHVPAGNWGVSGSSLWRTLRSFISR